MTKEKQFARAKAIAVLECMAIDLTGALAEMAEENPMAEVLKQRLEAIDTAQAALREQPRWISVDERLPEEKDTSPNKSVLAIEVHDGFAREWIWDSIVLYPNTFTHWMPLPSAEGLK